MTERDNFLAALEITDLTARKAYLDMACGGNAALRAAVEALFASHEGAGSFLNTAIVEMPGSTSSADTKADNLAVSKFAAAEQTVQFSQDQAAKLTEDDDDNDDTADEIPLGYLSPSKKPDSLGRLGHYEVLEVLGKGAFGTVLKAFDEQLHRMVAIKVMSIELASTSPARKRFLREARASAAIRHHNVVAIYAVEEQPIPYLVMEYIPGKTLADALVGEGPLALTDSLRLSQQIASGLAAAHSQGLIHRDIKPANILLEEGVQWKVKITDFGLARAADDASVTQSGTIAGTPMFMSPEQAHSNNIDQRSDLFSFGSVMYQMVSGRLPFRASSTLAVLKRLTEDTPRPIQEIIPEVPDWLVTIISKLHAKKADDRYQTAQEVADLLAHCQSELQHAGKVTCVQSSRLAPRDEPSTTVHPSSTRPSPDRNTSQPAIAQPSATLQGSSRRSETATLKRPLLFAALLAGAAIIAVVVINRDKSNPDVAGGDPQPSVPASEISNSKSQIPAAAPSWHGWPSDAPPPAIAPFNAEQARQHQEVWAKYLNIDVEYTNSIGMKFRLIPPGEFTIGSTPEEIEESLKFTGEDTFWQETIKSEAPQHKVILTQPIYLGVNEVTQADYEKVMGVNPSHFAPSGEGKEAVAGLDTGSHAVETVSWNDAAEFCAKLSKQEELKPFYFRAGETITPLDGTGYRLPTEAEWEYACRAGTTTKFWIGEQDEELVRAGWFGTNSGGRTHAAGELKANPYGRFDIHGNVWEWVEDWWEPTYYGDFQERPAINPNGLSPAGAQRVIRGGDFDSHASYCRAAGRHADHPTGRYYGIGFRVSLVAGVSRVSQASKVTGPAMSKSVATTPSAPVELPIDYAAERKAAEWLANDLQEGSSFELLDAHGQHVFITPASRQLPDDDFVIHGLNLTGPSYDDAGFASLAGCRRIQYVHLYYNPVLTAKGLQHLTSSVRLKHLGIWHCPTIDGAVIPLLATWKELGSLILNGCVLSPEDQRSWPAMPQLI